jgi:hypothetical protein
MNLAISSEYEMSVFPEPGQLLLYIDLSELVRYRPIADGLEQLARMGYTPQLRYNQWTDDQGHPQVSLLALLRDVRGVGDEPDEAIGQAADALNEAFPEPLVVHCSWRPMTQERVAA